MNILNILIITVCYVENIHSYIYYAVLQIFIYLYCVTYMQGIFIHLLSIGIHICTFNVLFTVHVIKMNLTCCILVT